ncbi:hypothetical protein BDV40DRAFT_304047 [Aspergillus tamarii]|uniref:Zn(2)-C6 fungal-type domain-containing protein n=1 Tax=Aspergillus tamarii TaxID=41984 RepID=A0A5N6UJ58_ASPTM|nr:hypothetical protein BDV40DRAFT_304047 [Aspergillus tamarii]
MSSLPREGDADPKVPVPGVVRRSYKACTACQVRKIRCVVKNRDGKCCFFDVKTRTYNTTSRRRKAQEKRARVAALEKPPSQESLEGNEKFSVRSSADALLFLSDAAVENGGTTEPPRSALDSAGQHGSTRLPPSISSTDMDISETLHVSFHAKDESPWDNPEVQNRVSTFQCTLFRESIVLPHEALAYLFFFSTDDTPDLQGMRLLFEQDDLLLGCIITVSSRYYHLPSPVIGGYERSNEIHNRCWLWVRGQLAKVLFEGSTPQSPLSVIEVLLMLAEWLPKPIHALVDYNNVRFHGNSGRPTSQFISKVILEPAFRTDQVSWSYVGNAFLLLRSLPPNRRICPIMKTSNRYILALFSCLIMSQSLARRLGRQPLMRFEDVDLAQVSQAFDEHNQKLLVSKSVSERIPNLSLGFSDQFHLAFVGLMKLLVRAQEVLHPPIGYGTLEPKAESPDMVPHLLTLMQHFNDLNQSWKAQSADLFEADAPGMSSFSKLMLRVDIEYLRLYEFSASLGIYIKHVAAGEDISVLTGRSFIIPSDNNWEFPPTSLAYYIEQAIDAADTLLRLMLSFQSPTTKKTLRYASSRYYMKIVFAAVFLIQALRAGIPNIEYKEVLTETLESTIVTLETCSIDAAHPAFRYSILLQRLMNDLRLSSLSDKSSIFALTIGPRLPRIPLLPISNEAGGMSQVPGSSTEQRQFQTDLNATSSLSGTENHRSLLTVNNPVQSVPSDMLWSAANDLALGRENSVAVFDDDPYFQSFLGSSVFNTSG